MFIDSAGIPTQDNTNFFWDDTNNSLRLGGTSVGTGNVKTPFSIVGTSTTYLQTYHQNLSAGAGASGDIVVGNNIDDGTVATGTYNDMGICSSAYSDAGFTLAGASDSYYIGQGGNLLIVASSASKVIKFATGGVSSTNERMRITDSGVGIGTTTPLATFDVANGNGITLITGADTAATTRTNATTKASRWAIPHYLTAEEPMLTLLATSTSTANILQFGGGSIFGNAATSIQFYTAANYNTTTGTQQMSISSGGIVSIGTHTGSYWLDIRKDSGDYIFAGSTAGSTRFDVKSTGRVGIGLVGWYPTTNGGQTITTGSGGCFIGYDTSGDLAYGSATSVTVGRPNDRLLNATAGSVTQKMFDVVGNFSPTSGSALFVGQSITNIINQTGGASGITRSLYINPTITAAADYRALEISNNSGKGVYQTGASATNYFAGRVGFGETAPDAEVHVKAAVYTAGGHSGIYLKSSTNNAGDLNNGPGIIFGNPTPNATANVDGAAIFSRQFGTDQDNTGLVFAVRNNTNTANRTEAGAVFYDTTNSKVQWGFGTTAPTETVSVGGNISATGWAIPATGVKNDVMYFGASPSLSAGWTTAFVLLHASDADDTGDDNYCYGTMILRRSTSSLTDAVINISSTTDDNGDLTGSVSYTENASGGMTIELVEVLYNAEYYSAIRVTGDIPRPGSFFTGIINSVGNTAVALTAIDGATATSYTVINSPTVNSNEASAYSQLADNARFKKISVGTFSSPTALLHLAAGTATANTAPLRFTSGTNLSVAVAGAMEYDGTQLYFSPSTTRNALIQDNGTRLTSGRIPFATTNGYLVDDADLTFVTDTLTATKIVGTTSIKVGTAAGYISSDGSTGATGTFLSADAKTITVKDGIITSIV